MTNAYSTSYDAFQHGYALLVGVGNCSFPKLSLPVTVNDVQSLYAALIDPELCAYTKDHIRVLNNDQATQKNILDGLHWLGKQVCEYKDTTVFIYFSGHGALDTRNGNYYLLTHETDPLDIANSGLPSDVFTNALRKIDAKRLLVILDCCHAAGMATSKEGDAVSSFAPSFTEVSASKATGMIDILMRGEGRAVFASSKHEQSSWIKDKYSSIYTFYLLEALHGEDSKPGDTEVRISNLMHYLGEVVPDSARTQHRAEQTPWFDMGTDDFAIARLRGGKGLPEEGWEAVKPEVTRRMDQIARKIYQHGKYIVNIGQAAGIHIGDKCGDA